MDRKTETLVDVSVVQRINKYLPENSIFADMCAFFSVFADVTRVRILTILLISELCVNDIATILRLNQTTASHQLKLLRDAGMVETARDGKVIYYKVTNKYVNDIMLTGTIHLGF
jgi:ArsR family transcriptional regulator